MTDVALWSCPECAFTFDAVHTDVGGGYSCPACAESRLSAELAVLRAQRDQRLDSDSMEESYLECPDCGATIRARMAGSAATNDR